MRTTLLAAAALAIATIAPRARADVVMPPPTNCPPGETGTTSHAGPRCVKNAPTDCPVGWAGILGGTCMLRPCKDDAGCQEGEECAMHSACLEPYEDGFYDWGEEQEEADAGTNASREARGPFMAAPMMPRRPRAKPIWRYNAVNVCSADAPCALPETCQSERLCVPKGKRAAPYLGTNVSGARVARKTDAPLTSGKTPSGLDPETPPAVRPETTTPPGAPTSAEGRGCGGCAASGEAPIAAPILLAAAAASILAARRKTKR